MSGLRVIVCGGRDFAATSMDERDFVHNTLSNFHHLRPISCVIHGGATGADEEGMNWAQMMSLLHCPFIPDWHAHGKAAGPLRNQRMIDEGKPDAVIAFPGGRGTADMVRRAKVAGIETIEYLPPLPGGEHG